MTDPAQNPQTDPSAPDPIARELELLRNRLASREDELGELRAVSDAVLRALESWVVLVDREQRVLFANDSFCRARGVSRMEAIGRKLIELMGSGSPENVPVLEAFTGALQGSLGGNSEARLSGLRLVDRPAHGAERTERIVDVRVTPVGGSERRALVAVADITEYWRAQEEVIREKRKLNDMVQATGAGLSLLDRDRRVIWANRVFLQWFGDPAGRSCFQVFRCTDRVCHNCEIQKVATTGGSVVENWSTYTSGGNRRHFQNTVTPIRDERGQVYQYLVLTEDVTDRESKIEQLNLLRRLGEVMAGTLDLDRLFNLVLTCVTAGHALGFNRAFLFLRDRASNRLVPKQAVGPTGRDEALRIWGELAARQTTIESVFDDAEKLPPAEEQPLFHRIRNLSYPVEESNVGEVLVRAAVEKQPLVITDAWNDPRVTRPFRDALGCGAFVVVPLLAKGEVTGVILADNIYSGRPITGEHTEILSMFANQAGLAIENANTYAELLDKMARLRSAQARMLHAENLATIGRMAAHVAHEIRNPLTTIGGFARSMLKHPERQDRVESSAQVIVEEVKRLESILSQVMDFSRPARPEFAVCDLAEVLKKTVAEQAQALQGRGVALDLEVEPGVPAVQADGEKLKQVLINLVRNAAEAMPGGGAVSLALRRDGVGVEIAVTDTGPGIAPKVLEKMFSPFFTTKPDGTGLGLAVSRKIVEDHGGKLIVRSEIGRGTTFTITLPVERAPEAVSEADLHETKELLRSESLGLDSAAVPGNDRGM